jgi:cytoskeletal protein CcmA (bactofilin family)
VDLSNIVLLVRSGVQLLGDCAGALAWGGKSRGMGRMAETADDLSIPNKLVRPASGASAVVKSPPDGFRPAGGAAAALPPTPTFLRASGQPAIASLSRAQGSLQTATSADTPIEARKLVIGQGTVLSGEINSCDRIVVEGSVRANLQKCQHMTLAETGFFDGSAAIDDAEIHGRFEGDLVVYKRLVIARLATCRERFATGRSRSKPAAESQARSSQLHDFLVRVSKSGRH